VIRRVTGGGAVERENESTNLDDIDKKKHVFSSNDNLLIKHVELLRDDYSKEAAAKDGCVSLDDQTQM